MGHDEKRSGSADKLNEYIRIGSPGIIILIVALVAVLAAFIYWGVTGTLYMTQTVTGIVDINPDGDVRCFVDADSFSGPQLIGTEVSMELPGIIRSGGKVLNSWESPLAREEFQDTFDYTSWQFSHLLDGEYFYMLDIGSDADLSDNQRELVEVSLIAGTYHPIDFFMQ